MHCSYIYIKTFVFNRQKKRCVLHIAFAYIFISVITAITFPFSSSQNILA